MSFSEESKAAFLLAQSALPSLIAEYGPEEKARQIVLTDLAKRKVLICFHCKCENKIPSSVVRMFLCKKCRKEIWITARTNYHKAKKFLVRLLVIRLFEMGITLTANQAATLLHVSTDTINRIYGQVGIAVISKLPEKAVEVPSEYAISIICRRTTETPARKPPVEEEFEMQRVQQKQAAQSISKDEPIPGMPELSDLEQLIFEILSESPVNFEQLSQRTKVNTNALSGALTFLELRGLIHAQPGNKFARAKSFCLKNASRSEKQSSIAKSFNFFVTDYFQGIGRKKVQIYGNFFWLAHDRKTWRKGSLRELYACHPYISYQDILDFVTPLTFKLVPCLNTS